MKRARLGGLHFDEICLDLTAQEYIQSKVIEVAKEKIFDLDKSVNQIANELGFKYPQHFNRLFKQRVGQSPNEFRMLN